MAPPIIVTEDTPPDMLAGSMDLTVLLPSGHSLKMSVERSTPMMDLLVQVTTANKMSPAGYIIKPLNDRGPLPYKPSTPIGALDAWTIHVVPKQNAQCTNIKKSLKALNQPFEQTFRLQVHLPRNQLYVARISPKTRLTDILLQVCSEKNLDPLKYSLRHPSNLDQVLNLSCTLADYKLQEITLVCNRNHPVEVSTVDIMSLQREGANPAYRNTMCEGSVSSGSLEGRSLSPVPSDESSASPPPLPPSRPTRKRRPAPKPPIVNQKALIGEKQQNGITTTAVYHSRNSSDSSGYHEASVLSESPQSNSVPEVLAQRKMASVSEDPASGTLSQSLNDMAVIEPVLKQASSCNSISSLSSTTGRKKKTAPPPPQSAKNRTSSLSEDQQRTPSVSSTASSTTTLDGNEMTMMVKSATLPPSSRLNSEPKRVSPPSSLSPPTKVEVESPTTPQGCAFNTSDARMEDEEIDRIFTNAIQSHISPEFEVEDNHPISLPTLPSPPSSLTQFDLRCTSQRDELLDWEYKLPVPPTFRDETKSPTVTELGPQSVGELSIDTVHSDATRQDNNTRPYSKEIIEDTIVIQTNVNYPDELKSGSCKRNDINPSQVDSLVNLSRTGNIACTEHNTLDQENKECQVEHNETRINKISLSLVQKPNKHEIFAVDSKHQSQELFSGSALENFKITTYKDTKPVEVFEDESIKSSVGEKRDKSKDDAMFRAPKPIVKEPNLSRTSSFSLENKLRGPLIKRSVSYVSLLAANMPRNSQPYRAHLTRHYSCASKNIEDLWPQLRKTTSEVYIGKKDAQTKDNFNWQDNSSELQSVQVLRNILSQSQASLNEPDDFSHLEHKTSYPPVSDQRLEDTINKSTDDKKWGRSQSDGEIIKWHPKGKIETSLSLDQDDHSKLYTNIVREPPSIQLSTWSERPKRQISIKTDCDYTSGFGSKSIMAGESTTDKSTKNNAVSLTKSEGVITKNLDYNFESRSKSISDLSRIPVVRAVELKKPFAVHSFDCSSLKPVKILDDLNPPNLDYAECRNFKSKDDNSFIGVNSLAKRFETPQKRPISMHDSSFNQGSNFQTTIEKSAKSMKDATINNGSNYISDNTTKVERILLRSSQDIKELEQYNTRHCGLNSKPELTSSESKLCSSGIAGNDLVISSITGTAFHQVDKNIVHTQNSTRNKYNMSEMNPSRCSGYHQNKNNINLFGESKSPIISNASLPSNSSKTVVSVNTLVRQSQIPDRTAKPVHLQPVVKGFRTSVETQSSLYKELALSSSKTKDFKVLPLNSSNPDSSVYKTTYHRALSTPKTSTPSLVIRETAKEKNDEPPLVSKHKQQTVNVIPDPPPLLPVLKPVGDRKNKKLLPPPEAHPRDQLMSSIRSFEKGTLNKVSK